jgi:fibronectin-binding autotransporter adhesin
MITKTPTLLPLIVAALLWPVASQASIYSFDPGSTPATPSGGTGTWDIVSPIWSLAGADVVWGNDGTHNATFGGTAGTVTIGGTVINANALTFNTTGYTVTGGTLNFSGTTPTITNATSVSTIINSTLKGTTGLVLAGTGTSAINNAANTLSGGIKINSGALTTSTAGSLGTNVITLNGGTFSPRANLTNDLLVTANSTIDMSGTGSTFTVGALSVGSQTITIGSGSGTSNGNVSFGATTLTGNATITNAKGGSSINQTSANATFSTVTVGDAVATGTTTTFTINASSTATRTRQISLNGAMSDNATDATKILALNITSGGATALTVNVGGANTYTGGTTVGGNNTILRLTTDNDRLPTGTNLTINGGASVGGIVDLNTFNQKVGALSGGSGTVKGIVTNNAAGTGTATLTVESTSTSSTFAGVIQNGATAKVALTKAGTGTSLTLTGTNTYTGATSVNGGSLIVDGSLASGSAVSVNAGGTLGGSGTIAGATTFAAGSKLSAGSNSIATLTFSSSLDISAAANDTAAFVFTLGTAFDKIVASSLTLGTNVFDAADLSITTGTGFTSGQSYTLFENSSVTGTFISFLMSNIGGSGIDGTVALSGNNVVLTTSAIPEPSTYALLLGGTAALLACSIRSRRRG